MTIRLKFIRLLLLTLISLFGIQGSFNLAEAQELGLDFAQRPQVTSIRIGPHPTYTRILVNLTEMVSYEVKADFANKRITLVLPYSEKGRRLRSRSFNDKNLEQYLVRPSGEDLEVTFVLQNQNTRFFHSVHPQKSQIILDIKGENRPILRTRIGKPQRRKPGTQSKLEPGPEEAPLPKRAKLVGYSPKKILEIVSKSKEVKEENGWEDYQKALKEFQETKYPSAGKMFREFHTNYPESKYLDHILYLKAESEYRITFKELNPIFDRALASFKLAMRKFPKSKFYDHALLKVASIFDEYGYNLEARALYKQGLKSNPKSLYNEVRKNNLAAMLMKEGKLEKAFKAFQSILRKSPNNVASKAGIFEIANKFFEKKDLLRALKIYEAGTKRWPGEINEKPEISYVMAEIYYSQKKFKKARKHFFNLLNLDPASKNSHKALNRIGDSYMVEGNYQNALSVFDESGKRKSIKRDDDGRAVFDKEGVVVREDSAQTQYGKIRMADIGVRSPRLKIRDIVFDVEHYYKPFKTFDEIFVEARNVDILAEVTLSRGIAYLLEQNYLKAIDEFKKLLPLGPESQFFQEADRYIRQALIALIGKYAQQDGNLPILYSYSDFISLPIGDIKNAQTLLQVGEAYQAIGMFTEAVKFYEKVKVLDSNKTYRDRVFLNLGKIHLENKSYDDAVLVGRKFLKIYPRSKWISDAMKLLARALIGRGEYPEAINIYKDLLARATNKAEIHYFIGETYTEMNKLTDAAQSYQKTIATYDRQEKVVPAYLQNAYYHLGASLFKLNRFAPAIEALKSASELFPDNPYRDWADYLMIESLEKLGDPSKITEGLNRLVKVENGNELTRQAAESRVKFREWEKQLKEG
ncbi:MAG: tetratricopeptide repeat protein [Nitrospina sp.]|jgi:tetratricopeptide (TPR) repeat protein|nr:tetratricopeptide repeat protein [Nitrospina sp.]MBT3876939.1 tetratricopeptide repeat protein [Nitrospina sp.]MBT4047933.1 tetratricopeptide repeat protein [Nitrospina sp.]MBT4558841.1 tetratricopeptide repeat protein [Nitrospina sp.]MBT5348361.1 tetratricopeptide repeat protein [Nitrospina sp.]